MYTHALIRIRRGYNKHALQQRYFPGGEAQERAPGSLSARATIVCDTQGQAVSHFSYSFFFSDIYTI